MTARHGTVTVIGEALVDLVRHGAGAEFSARPGGSPFNVAIGLARLGHRTSLMARLADNAFGRMLRDHAAAEGIDLSHAPCPAEPTTLAVVSIDADAQADYDFYCEGTADWQWTAAEAARLPAATGVLHFGSAASWTAPGDAHIDSAVRALRDRGGVLISYDPNVRPALLGRPSRARPLIERGVGAAHVVKASREDIAWLYPDSDVEQVAARWLGLGALLVVISDGAAGAHLFRPGTAPLRRGGRTVEVRDTVGAGDAFMSGLLDALLRRGLGAPERVRESSAEALAAAVDDAILVSALTCERVGADPPTALPRPHLAPDAPLSRSELRFGAIRAHTPAAPRPAAPGIPVR